ncbi:hypothetical protein EYF80_032393 [Liparis tanakae]|uniref:Uncharacterized protein n=1 Tax=Liparis tanakae TaxID=230148 RepID=A0A4Z2GXU2_9TELE|nr:hypothetical protein EYF80_032393 [Liparis tanakae]
MSAVGNQPTDDSSELRAPRVWLRYLRRAGIAPPAAQMGKEWSADLSPRPRLFWAMEMQPLLGLKANDMAADLHGKAEAGHSARLLQSPKAAQTDRGREGVDVLDLLGRVQGTGGRAQGAGDRGQGAGDRGLGAGDKGQGTGGRGQGQALELLAGSVEGRRGGRRQSVSGRARGLRGSTAISAFKVCQVPLRSALGCLRVNVSLQQLSDTKRPNINCTPTDAAGKPPQSNSLDPHSSVRCETATMVQAPSFGWKDRLSEGEEGGQSRGITIRHVEPERLGMDKAQKPLSLSGLRQWSPVSLSRSEGNGVSSARVFGLFLRLQSANDL